MLGGDEQAEQPGETVQEVAETVAATEEAKEPTQEEALTYEDVPSSLDE